MPKERRFHSMSLEQRYRTLPYPSNSSSRNPPEPLKLTENVREWEDIRCPVCMEYPHNAVLLLCSSYNKGCRPFMCDTSYRHSNCLDQYRKTSESRSANNVDNTEQPTRMACPLCRGLVTGWTVVEPARMHMNAKSRSCSTESCAFSGSYGQLRKHARKEHPFARPSEADPERQQNWMRMEQERDISDLFSMFDSAVTGEQDGVHVNADGQETGSSIFFPSTNGQETGGGMFVFPSTTMLLVVHVRTFSRSLPRTQRGRRASRWGDQLRNLTFSPIHRADDDLVNDGGGYDEVDAIFQDNE